MFFFTFSSNLNPADKKLIDAYKNNFNEIKYSIEKDINDRDLETEKNQSIYIQELEEINNEINENNIKLAWLKSDYDNAYKRDWSKDLKLICEQITEFEKNNNYNKIKTSHKEFSPTDEILKYWAESFFYKLINVLHNMKNVYKTRRFWEAPVQLDDLKNCQGFEELYSKIEELSCKVSEESIPEKFKNKFIDPIKRIFAYKNFTAEIKKLHNKVLDLEVKKNNIKPKSLYSYSINYAIITKDTKHLEEQIKYVIVFHMITAILFRESKEELYKSEVKIEFQKKNIQTVRDNIKEKCQTLAELKAKKEDLEQKYEITKKDIDEKND